MGEFSFKNIYLENNRKVLEVNILPEKHCNFDCIFCPLGRAKNRATNQKIISPIEQGFMELGAKIKEIQPELIFINSKGEALLHEQIAVIIEFIKNKNLPIRLLSNGYLLGEKEYQEIANKCDEIIGEIKVASDENFQKLQRPITGYTFEEHIDNMTKFVKQYTGKFILEITLLKGYNDTPESIQKLKSIVKKIAPQELQVVRISDTRFQKKLGIIDAEFESLKNLLMK